MTHHVILNGSGFNPNGSRWHITWPKWFRFQSQWFKMTHQKTANNSIQQPLKLSQKWQINSHLHIWEISKQPLLLLTFRENYCSNIQNKTSSANFSFFLTFYTNYLTNSFFSFFKYIIIYYSKEDKYMLLFIFSQKNPHFSLTIFLNFNRSKTKWNVKC